MGNSGSGYKVADAVVTEAAKDIATTRDDLQGDIDNLRTRLESLNGQWEGSGGNAFRGAIRAWENTARRVMEAMTTFEQNLMGSESTYTNTEDAVTQRLNKYNNAL